MNWQDIIFIGSFVPLFAAFILWLVVGVKAHKVECREREEMHRQFFDYIQQRIESLKQR